MISGTFAVLVGLLILTLGFLLGVAYTIWDRSRSSGNEPRWQTIGRNVTPKTPELCFVQDALINKDLKRRVFVSFETYNLPGEVDLFVIATDDVGFNTVRTLIEENVPS